MDGNGETTIFYVKIWFIIQLKEPLEIGCFGYEVDIFCFFNGVYLWMNFACSPRFLNEHFVYLSSFILHPYGYDVLANVGKKTCTLGEYFPPFREAFAEPVIGVDCVGESSKQELPIVTFVEGKNELHAALGQTKMVPKKI